MRGVKHHGDGGRDGMRTRRRKKKSEGSINGNRSPMKDNAEQEKRKG
jgi:hypothetical protein